MRSSLTFVLVLWMTSVFGQSPHGKSLEIDCSYCHTSAGWKFDSKTSSFSHDSTKYKLVGKHQVVNCRSCHKSLEFSTAKNECIDCHNDLHEGTLGPECARCHSPNSWIVENILDIHRLTRFPLTGAHQLGDCKLCHKSGSVRRFEPLSIECLDCHRASYLATTKPNHQQAGYSTNCIQCHKAGSAGWVAQNIEHTFFPLTGGHDLSCTLCHTTGDYKKIPTECYSCHKEDYNKTNSPNHQLTTLSTNCLECHTTNPGWKPAKFVEHDGRFFPIFSGKHANTWANCTECHKQSGDYSVFSCIDCHDHAQTLMADKHKETNGFQYNSVSCFTCHPRGDKEGGFNHSKTNFPLTGAHVNTDCLKCHIKGFAGTSVDCNACHAANYAVSVTPAHVAAGLPSTCTTCHNTTSWRPSTFNHTTTGFALTGGHATIVQCSLCHKGTVLNTKTDCIACHQVQYDGAKDHKAQSYPVDCKMCHNADNWLNASFNHSATSFPLTGAHTTVTCAKC
ncbi:MAG: hypothetical protein WCW62_08815, partial [Bacteroidales bacterium]